MPRKSRTFKTRGNQAYSAGRTPYTRSASGRMSVNGNTAGGSTQGFTNADTGKVSNGGRLQDRDTRYREVRRGFNNITPTAARAMLDAGFMTPEEYDRGWGSGAGSGTGSGSGTGAGGGGGLGLSAS